MSINILLVTAFYEDHIAYQEVQIAKYLRKLGHKVLVISSDRSNYDLSVRYDDSDGKTIIRIKNHIRIKNTFFPMENLHDRVISFAPDIAFVIHPNAGLPYFILKDIPKSCKVISFFGDLRVSDKVGKANVKGNTLIQKYLKNNWYRRTFERSDSIVANTNETVEILKSITTTSLDNKILMPGLGFDPDTYYYSELLREETRDKLNIKKNQIVFLTITRVYSGKPILEWFEPIIVHLRNNPDHIYLFSGFMDTDFSRNIKNNLLGSNLGNQLRLFDFTTSENSNALFNAADYSVWFIPTISIQQSMATGLPAIIPNDNTLNHLVQDGYNGYYYSNFNELQQILLKLSVSQANRRTVSAFNQKFSYDSILPTILSRMEIS